MDKEFIKFMITPINKDDNRLIQEGDFIDSGLVDILCSAPISYMKNAFAPIRQQYTKDKFPYKLELHCPECGNVFVRDLSKARLMETLRIINLLRSGAEPKNGYNLYEFLWCDKCIKVEQERREQESKKSRDLYIKKQEEELECYINSYINPHHSFKAELGQKYKESSIMNAFWIYTDQINERIQKAVCSLNYSDFLKTPYWDGIRSYNLRRSGYKCELCGSGGSLNVHHKTYANHGLEHIRQVADKDLIVLCKNCHQKFHEKLADKE